jgi:hypothetical protein
MNITTTHAPGTPATGETTAAARTETPRDTPADQAQTQVDFESALRRKQSRRDGESDGGEDQHKEPAEAPLAGLAAIPAPPVAPGLQRAAEAPSRGTLHTAEGAQSGTPRAAIEAALNANITPGITEVGASDPAALWEASVREPSSIAVEVRALRAERTGNESAPAWTVAVKSPDVDADTLARHAPRLNERLRKHAAGFTHVRIESDDHDAT